MKAVFKLTAGLAVAGLAASAAFAARPFPTKVSDKATDSAGSVSAAAAGLNYSTGFETTEVPAFPSAPSKITNVPGTWPAGCGGPAFPCWGTTTAANASTITPTIADNNPFAGTQHVKLTFDLTTRTNQPNFNLGVDCRYPRGADLSVRPVAPNTASVEVAVDAPFGQDYRIQPQSNSQGFLATSALFFYSGGLYVLDDVCGSTALQFVSTGFFWDTSGAYQNYTVAMNPCTDVVNYFYGGAQIYSSCTYAGTNLEQFLVFGDNYPGSTMDFDNVVLSSLEECPAICGNGILEAPVEQCDGAIDANCPGRCQPNCTCAPICTLDAPCPVVNGINGPFVSSGGFYVYDGGSPFISVNGCGNSFDSAIQVQTVADIGTPIAFNDDCNNGPYGSGSDPSASCYNGASGNQYGSCTCFANPNEPVLIWMPRFTGAAPPLGSSSVLEIRKKAECGGASVGACCDTNGPDTGCTDNVTAANCVGADKVFTNQGKCANLVCECIPDCAGATCGDDGCGGSCGTCGDGNVCNGEETCVNRNCAAGTPLVCNDNNACNGVETCDPVAGCRPGTPLNCDDGQFCNGTETCNPSSGCVAGTAPNCDDGRECSVDSCDEEADACVNDDSGCAIPTVSEWGLVVLTLMLLIGAKVYFGRRQAIA